MPENKNQSASCTAISAHCKLQWWVIVNKLLCKRRCLYENLGITWEKVEYLLCVQTVQTSVCNVPLHAEGGLCCTNFPQIMLHWNRKKKAQYKAIKLSHFDTNTGHISGGKKRQERILPNVRYSRQQNREMCKTDAFSYHKL